LHFNYTSSHSKAQGLVQLKQRNFNSNICLGANSTLLEAKCNDVRCFFTGKALPFEYQHYALRQTST
jgi:hypothetical protein